jgi:hypothetical protein
MITYNVYQIKGIYVISLEVKDHGAIFKMIHRAVWLWMDNIVSTILKIIVSHMMD